MITMAFVSWPKITFMKVLCEEVHSHGAKTTLLTKDLVFFNECAAIKCSKTRRENA
jgi:hypothetical protein